MSCDGLLEVDQRAVRDSDLTSGVDREAPPALSVSAKLRVALALS